MSDTVLTDQPTPSTLSQDVRRTYVVCFLFLASGFLAIFLYRGLTAKAATPVLWSLACFACGAFIGFLFGIPKILQGNQSSGASSSNSSGSGSNSSGNGAGTPGSTGTGSGNLPQSTVAEALYRQRVNTNLEEISDWLTKIIVGLGLVQLKDTSTYLRNAAAFLAGSMGGPGDHRAFALALILYFTIIGFLSGYLMTRLYLAGALNRADRASISEVKDSILDFKATQAIIGSMQTSLEQMKQEVFKNKLPANSEPAFTMETATEQIDPALLQMANDYLAIHVPDYGERLRLKNEAAVQMANYVIEHQIPKNLLAAQTNEGLILALATVINNLYPEPGDAHRLLSVAGKVSRLHVKYRIVTAFSRLIELKLVNDQEKRQILEVLSDYSHGADRSLAARIDQLRSLIQVSDRSSSA